MKDYELFNLSPPVFAQQALIQLWKQKDPYALSDADLTKLKIQLPSNPTAPTTPVIISGTTAKIGFGIDSKRQMVPQEMAFINANGPSCGSVAFSSKLFLVVALFTPLRHKRIGQAMMLLAVLPLFLC